MTRLLVLVVRVALVIFGPGRVEAHEQITLADNLEIPCFHLLYHTVLLKVNLGIMHNIWKIPHDEKSRFIQKYSAAIAKVKRILPVCASQAMYAADIFGLTSASERPYISYTL